MIELSEESKQYARKLWSNLELYCKVNLKIKDKSGALVPFIFNRPQQYLHEKLEEQKRITGKVRALILKGRQEGCTTYVNARYYHRVVSNFGLSVGTLSHLSDTTDKIYGMIDRFLDNSAEHLRPDTPINNSREIKFDGINCEWNLGTAGTDETGRGGTLQLFHGSEVAFWPHPEKLRSGVMQSVADVIGTEVILESTANGMDAFFYQMCIQAMHGESDYQLIFIPWFWMEEYKKPTQQDFTLTDEEHDLTETYGIDNEQLNWRRHKIKELGSVYEFRKEYPCNPIEAFQTSGNSFIPNEMIVKARKRQLEKFSYQDKPLIMGVDCSRVHDRLVFSFRKGRKLLKSIIYDPKRGEIREGQKITGHFSELSKTFIESKAAFYIETYGVELACFDTSEGYGQAVVEGLHVLNSRYKQMVKGVMFGASADDDEHYANKRSEMWHRLHSWLIGDDGDVQIPDDDAIHADLTCMPKPEDTVNHRKKMPDKAEIIKKFGMSPDIGDSIALTFAFLNNLAHSKSVGTIKKKDVGGLKTMHKKRGHSDTLSPRNIFARPV